uniref:histidine kinase n=1 Tax=Candidatus Methanogaster sp. ANME-2c ERB4 TaxID=2759911 RepID=A0A7G9Y857_9EURY|nr:adaptive-response sensory-kinase SasA [Methanosarcinales archaeon ANME-2c ERB4]QNO44191.1 adaptive-response sensory-kinase SasA [Methanosarcinales archaeon ANME-2c ERB4]QNO46561.1 adaptive-response sensory-kinase SasA [Methanosarcinales archaeon ANME-2c ERB4]
MVMGAVHTGKIRILIVEDEAIVAEDLELAVTNIGYEVVGRAVSADAAVDKAVKLNPDLVLMDIVLRGEKNGIDASREIKEKVEIPVIFLTAYSDVGLIDKAKSTEPYAYLVKPFQERQLLASIETALHKSGIEKRLEESEKWLATTLMSIGDAVIATDGVGYVKSMNHVAERLTGWKQEDASGKPLTEIFKIINGATGEEIENPVTRILREGAVVELTGQTTLITKDGAKIPIDDSFAPIKNDKGGIIGTVLAFRDITERKHAEDERERLVKELEAKNSEMERFTYTVSHDLRSPLTTIQGFASVLRMDLEKGETERVKKNLKYIERGIIKMARLLNDTLELSRIGRVANPSEDVPFGELVSEALEQTTEQVKSGGVEISVSEDFPAVYVDRIKIVEVLVNLIENSINYMGDELHPKIDIGYRTDDDETVFFVRDNGIGIDPELHEKVFELFCKLDRSTKGTGAGLAIVKRIIKVHGGRIWIESEKGDGCTVCATLPIASD